MKLYRIYNTFFYLLFLLTNPKLIILLLTQKIYIPVYVQFTWIKDLKIKTFIDIGCYKGHVTKTILNLFPSIKVFAFEPNVDLHKTIIKNTYPYNIFLTNMGLSDKNSEEEFFIYPDQSQSSTLKLTNGKTVKKNKIKTNKLDYYFNNIDIDEPIFLKIDTQGTELNVLKGAKKTLKKVAVIHIETAFEKRYKGQFLFKDVYEFLTKNKFVFMGEAPESYFYPLFGLKNSSNSIFINEKYLSKIPSLI